MQLISSEWGYVSGSETGAQPLLDELQAKYLCRQWLVNWLGGASVSIWFKWKGGLEGPFFGVVGANGHRKLSYFAAVALQQIGSSMSDVVRIEGLTQIGSDTWVEDHTTFVVNMSSSTEHVLAL